MIAVKVVMRIIFLERMHFDDQLHVFLLPFNFELDRMVSHTNVNAAWLPSTILTQQHPQTDFWALFETNFSG